MPIAGTLTERDLAAGFEPSIGDTVILSDLARCQPQHAIALENVKGKWWLRRYTTESGQGEMLCVEQRDMQDPQSCLAPALTYPLRLEGTYDIWVGTYRDVAQGGIDIKLSGDTTYFPIRPALEDAIDQWPPTDTGRLVECFWTTRELAGQEILLRQPHGTYGTIWWGMCNAHVAYIKLIRRDPAQLRQGREDLARLKRKTVIWDRDGYSYVWQWGEQNLDCILQQIEMLRDAADIVNWCTGPTLQAWFPHPMSLARSTTAGRLGDQRFTRVYRYFEEQGMDILQVLVERCVRLGLKIHTSCRANKVTSHNRADLQAKHPAWLGQHGLNYADEGLQAFLTEYLLYIPEHYDVDGLTIDLTRAPLFFNDDQPGKMEAMTRYLRGLRTGLDRLGRAKGKRLDLFVTFECEGMYRNSSVLFRPRGWTPSYQGLDVQTWVNERIVDCIMPEGKDVEEYIAMCRGTPVMCCPRLSASLTFDGQILRGDWQDRPPGDPQAHEDKRDICIEKEYGPLEILAGILKWYDAGAHGVFLFNQEGGGTPLRHLRYPELSRQELAAGRPYGRQVRERITWSA